MSPTLPHVRTRLTDLAEQAGVSTATVSRVLNGKHGVVGPGPPGRPRRPRRARLRATREAAHPLRRPRRPRRPRAVQPRLPRLRPGHRDDAHRTRLHPAAVHPVPRRHHRGPVRRDAPRARRRRHRLRLRPARRHHRQQGPLPPAAQPRHADRAGQRLRRGRRRTRRSRTDDSAALELAVPPPGLARAPLDRPGHRPGPVRAGRAASATAFAATSQRHLGIERPRPRTSSPRCSRSRAVRPPRASSSTPGTPRSSAARTSWRSAPSAPPAPAGCRVPERPVGRRLRRLAR